MKVIMLLMILLMLAAGLCLPAGWNWVAVLLLIGAFLCALGQRLAGRAAGILINERNLMSLSRLQLVVWTTIIAATFLTIALARTRAALTSGVAIVPLDITVDPRIWALLGISGTSFVGAALVEGNKSNAPQPHPSEAEHAARAYDESPQQTVARADGVLYVNKVPADASVADLFQGDEVKNALTVDIGKVQMFLFTIIAATSYSAAILALFAASVPGAPSTFPPVSDGLIVLLGISHGTYVGGKTAQKTKTG